MQQITLRAELNFRCSAWCIPSRNIQPSRDGLRLNEAAATNDLGLDRLRLAKVFLDRFGDIFGRNLRREASKNLSISTH